MYSNVLFQLSTGTQIEGTEHYLKKLYKDTQFTGPDEEIWPPWPDKPKFFTSTTLVHHKDTPKGKSKQEIRVMAELRCKGNIRTVPKTAQKLRESLPRQNQSMETAKYLADNNIIKNIAGIFKPLDGTEGTPSPRIILIDGAPGIGKTYLCKEIAYQWSQGEILTDKRFLFLLRAHDQRIQLLKEVKDLIKYCCHLEHEQTIDEIYQHIWEMEGANLIVLLDGYNELSVGLPEDCLIYQLISRQRIGRCDIVITSRSSVYGSLCHFADCRMEVLGFTNNDRHQYIQKALEKKPDGIKSLKQYLDSHPTISSLCCIPLNMTIVLHLFTENHLPQSRSELYKTIVDLTIKFHITKDEKTYKNPQRENSLKESIKHKLSLFSYDALRDDKVIFSKEEIRKVCPEITECPDIIHGFGLLQATEHFTINGKTLSFNFAHSSVQEYLAACYIQSLSDDRQLDLLRDTFWNERYLNTWIIYVGLTQGRSFALKHFLSGNQLSLISKLFKEFHISQKFLQDKIKCLHLFQCFMEIKNEAMCKMVGESMEKRQINLSKGNLMANHIIILGFFLAHSYIVNWEILDLSDCNMHDLGLWDLWNALVPKRQSKISIKVINLSSNFLSEFSASVLIDLVKSCETEELYISNNQLGDKGAIMFISHLSSDTSLKLLLMDDNDISADIEDQIEQRVSTFTSLNVVGTNEHLYIQNINRPGDCIIKVLEWYAIKCELTNFSMCNCQVSDKTLEHILTLLVKNLNLKSLQFSHIRLHESIVNLFSSKLSSLKHVSNFSLVEPILCNSGANDFINNFSFSSNTKIVTLSDYKLYARQTMYVDILTLLKLYSSTITTLEIPKCLPKEGLYVDNLADVIKAAPLLQVIDVSENNLGPTRVQRLAKGIKGSWKLRSLIMRSSGIDDVAAEVIADCLENKTYLEVLNLGKNKILSKGAIAITNSLEKNTTLKVLDLHKNGIEQDTASRLSSMLANKANLLELNISQNNFETQGMIMIGKALQNITTLKVLNVSSNKVMINASKDIAEVIKCNNLLEVLNVSMNKLESLGCIKICKALKKHHPNLRVFNIRSNGVKFVAANEIAYALQDKQKLEMVNVSWNEFEGGLATIVGSLKSTRLLKELVLHKSGTMNQRAVNKICDVVNDNLSLAVLDLGSTKLLTSSADKIFRALASNSTLKLLSISGNKIEDSAVNQLTSLLARHPALTELLLHNNPLSDSAVQQIASKLLSSSTCASSLKKISVPLISNEQIKAEINKKIEMINRHREDDWLQLTSS